MSHFLRNFLVLRFCAFSRRYVDSVESYKNAGVKRESMFHVTVQLEGCRTYGSLAQGGTGLRAKKGEAG